MRKIIIGIVIAAAFIQPGARLNALEIATFVSDATPPMGHPLSGGWIKPVEGNDDPELAKGFILRDEGGTYVFCAVDWCTLHNDAYDIFRRKLAGGAGVDPSHVSVHCVHQHNSPTIDTRAQELLDQYPGSPPHLDRKWYETVTSNAGAAVKEAMKHLERVTEIGTSKAMVDRVASTRRVKGPDGKIQVRWSATLDADVRAAPEGKIDPWLRSLTFFSGDKPIAQVHFYATHPQSYYGDGRTTWDVPGIARERLQKETGIFQIYFTGCAGDITMGKYNDGQHERRQELAERMYDAMKRSIAEIKRQPAGVISWKVKPVNFAILKGLESSEEAFKKNIADPSASADARLKDAISLAWIERVRADRPIELSLLSIGSIRILNLPGEPFIDFQFAAQQAAPDDFVCVAGYTDGGPGYICTEIAFQEGGYEPSASNIAPES
ncbi:hypothetical protein HY256_07740, partial [Candidatus Sumerlaeota bacterium]|nr:hypothetical protein [Candidatus Sumerlaeota bacterium]